MTETVTGLSERGQPDASASSEFSIFTGGPLYRLQQRIRVVRRGERRLGLPRSMRCSWHGFR